MSNELMIAFGALVIFVLLAAAKIYALMRQSRAEWEQVDKSKLKEWEDDED